MSVIVTPTAIYEKIAPDNEEMFEDAVKTNAKLVFGEGRYYLDCKRRIGAKGKRVSIPDAYLIDLARNEPRLFVVENEISEHDLFKHIGVQLLEFSHNYRQAGRQVKTILFEEISKAPDIMKVCERYAKEKGYRNLDNLLDYLVFETPFQAVVIIDEETDELYSVVKQFSFPVEIIEFVTYKEKSGEKAYAFNPFLQDLSEKIGNVGQTDIGELDTIVVPAREEGFQETFIGENRWYAIRIHSSMIPQIKYIAAYRISPISAITHVASVSKIVPWEDTGKYCLEFGEPAREIVPIKLEQHSRGKAPQAPRYTSMEKLEKASHCPRFFYSIRINGYEYSSG